VHQDLGLVGMLSTIENLALTTGYETGFGARIHWRDEAKRARAAMSDLGFADLDVKAPVASLYPAQRTTVAIARALVGWEEGCSLLVLDEPTATLPGDDVQRLFDVIKRLKALGISILYVSHHLDEVFELADRVTVLRDACEIATRQVSELDHDSLIELIVGHAIGHAATLERTDQGVEVLQVRSLSGGNLHHLDLDVAPGEIVGLAGITGSGRETALGLISGQVPRSTGEVLVGDDVVHNYHPRSALDAGVAFVPADRAVRGAVASMSLRENLTLCDVSPHFIGGRLQRKQEKIESKHWIDKLSIKTSGTEALIGSLSGGNQQKVMFGKALRLEPKVFLLDEPTQGIDVGAKDQIHSLIDEAAGRGVAVVVASSDTEELVRLCHRVLVFAEGRVIAEFVGTEITAESIQQTQLKTTQRAS
jgi:ribose transport system ATP-binding protein